MRVLTAWLIWVSVSFSLLAQTPKEPTEKEKEEVDSGTPIASELVRKSCSPCHKIDDKLRMSRISWRRTTPEGWEWTIKRMVELNGLQIEPAAARWVIAILKTADGRTLRARAHLLVTVPLYVRYEQPEVAQ